MATDVTSSPDILLWPPKENPFEQFQAEQEELERKLLQSFDELESWKSDLEAEGARLAELEEELANQKAALEAEREKLNQERAEIQSEREKSLTQAESSQDTAAVEEVTNKLKQAQQEIESLRAQLSQQDSSEDRNQQEKLEVEEQYSALELELEHVRNRASELNNTLSCSRADWERERHNWDQERRELQALLSQQQGQLKDYLSRHETHTTESQLPPPDTSEDEDAQSKKEDAVVVGSVLAQFERIRNERAVRRRKTNG